MSLGNTEERIIKMKKAIKLQAQQRAHNILQRAKQEYDRQKNKLINLQKDKILQEYQMKKKNFKIQFRISTNINKRRLELMKQRQQKIDLLKKSVIDALKRKLTDQNLKKIFLTKLIVQVLFIYQGMIKLMQRNIKIRAHYQDLQLVKSIKNQCENQFNEIFIKQTKKDLKSNLIIDQQHMLDDEFKGLHGGLMLTCNDGRIVCNNTLLSRINLVFNQLLPQIRNGLFPKK